MVERSDPPRYVADSAGAPPVPPPGGYRGARRALLGANGVVGGGRPQGAPAEAPPLPGADARTKSPRTLGWIALAAGIGFVIVALILLVIGAADAFFSPTMLVLQLVVLGLAIAAVATRAGRVLGAVALTVALVLNVGTMGALSTVRVAATGSYAGHKTDKQKLWEAYPGIKDKEPSRFLNQQSLEQLQALADETLADVRAQLTAQYGLQWVKSADAQERPERNGYGGESMLVRFTSDTWATTTPVTGYAHKLEVMRTIESVIAQHGWRGMVAFNDPAGGVDPTMISKMYGGATPETQVDWEWFSDDEPDPGWFYADITDLANDTTGEYRASREQTAKRTGEPLEGLQLAIVGRYMLSEKKVDDFTKALTKYP
ncbi:hypothetical protein SAMN04488591_1909 [Microbacterium azadirachtae]|uniref:Uncharacterized protein n=1 Tax=Microbacterium azadirachtae TaxID=582680 RepID=A0A1I6HKP4_9MICO|nr:hypothetical protein [Microbacterium azadirachtae]SFR54907.1 hypothetical protein SAMN04488591_1909 [Microbacterium azadirachtae]